MECTFHVIRDPVSQKLRKRTYITFIGKAPQDSGCVMVIYQSLLEQIKKDFPFVKHLIDKSDNAGCYHNESLFSWKAYWPLKMGLMFKETMFNERQSGKDQCDRDTATAKRQMNYFIERGNNIENAIDMNLALCNATALCGFNSSVVEISGGKVKENPKSIKNISRVHSIEYEYINGRCTYFKVWQYYGIGKGKVFKVNGEPVPPVSKQIIPFKNNCDSFGEIKSRSNQKEEFSCPDVMCIKTFKSYQALTRHTDFEAHEYEKKASKMESVKDKWVERYLEGDCEGRRTDNTNLQSSQQDQRKVKKHLKMGWAIPVRTTRRLTKRQKVFLNRVFHDGEKSGNKVSAESPHNQIRKLFKTKDFLPVSKFSKVILFVANVISNFKAN